MRRNFIDDVAEMIELVDVYNAEVVKAQDGNCCLLGRANLVVKIGEALFCPLE